MRRNETAIITSEPVRAKAGKGHKRRGRGARYVTGAAEETRRVTLLALPHDLRPLETWLFRRS